MFTSRWRLLRIGGIDISIDASWVIILALLTWTMSVNLRAELPELPPGGGLALALAFFVCIVLHELGHALVAHAEGIPIRGITLFMFGGVAEMEDEPPSAGKEFLMAIAGPVVSAVLAAGFGVLAWVTDTLGGPAAAVVALGYLASINLIVLVFNLIPAFPLDGGRVFRALVWGLAANLRQATFWASLVGRGFAWVLIFFGIVSFFDGKIVNGLWLVLIGIFLNGAAQASYRQVVTRLALRGEPLRRIMNPHPVTVPPSVDLRKWVDDYVYRFHHKTFPVVVEDGRLEGVINTAVLARYPRSEWHLHTISEAMRRDLNPVTLSPDADALEVLDRMRRTGWSRLLVAEGGRLVGLVSLKDLARFLQLKSELEGVDDEHHSRPTAPHVEGRMTNSERGQRVG
jgi:Zn-dependent protease/CBS domain-containing protein